MSDRLALAAVVTSLITGWLAAVDYDCEAGDIAGASRGSVMIKAAALLAGVAVVGLVAMRVADAYTPTVTESDVNHDGVVNLLDLAAVATYFGQPAPTPTPLPGGGVEKVLVQDLVVEATGNWVNVGTVDTVACSGAIFYVTAQSTDATHSTYMSFRVNSELGTIQVDTSPTTFLFQNFNSAGGPILKNNMSWGTSPAEVFVMANPTLYSVKVTVEAHCAPAFP